MEVNYDKIDDEKEATEFDEYFLIFIIDSYTRAGIFILINVHLASF